MLKQIIFSLIFFEAQCVFHFKMYFFATLFLSTNQMFSLQYHSSNILHSMTQLPQLPYTWNIVFQVKLR